MIYDPLTGTFNRVTEDVPQYDVLSGAYFIGERAIQLRIWQEAEAGEDLEAGQWAVLKDGKLYKASALEHLRPRLVARSVRQGFMVEYGVDGFIDRAVQIGADYYLSQMAGEITTSVPTTGYLIKVGTAVSSNRLEINVEQSILL